MQEKFPEAEGCHVVADGYYVKHGYVLYDVVNAGKLRSMSQNGENRFPMLQDERIHHVRQEEEVLLLQ